MPLGLSLGLRSNKRGDCAAPPPPPPPPALALWRNSSAGEVTRNSLLAGRERGVLERAQAAGEGVEAFVGVSGLRESVPLSLRPCFPKVS